MARKRADLHKGSRIETDRKRNRDRHERIEDEIYASTTRDLLPRNRATLDRTSDDLNEPSEIRTPPMSFTDDELKYF